LPTVTANMRFFPSRAQIFTRSNGNSVMGMFLSEHHQYNPLDAVPNMYPLRLGNFRGQLVKQETLSPSQFHMNQIPVNGFNARIDGFSCSVSKVLERPVIAAHKGIGTWTTRNKIWERTSAPKAKISFT